MENTSPVEQIPSATPPVIHRSSNPFLIVLLVIAVLIIGLLGGYILWGNKTQQSLVSNTVQTQIATPTVSSIIATATPIVDARIVLKTYFTTQIPENGLKPYSIQYPEDWKLETKNDAASRLMTLSKNGYSLTIYQGAFGGGGCIFEGEVPNGPFNDLRGVRYTQLEIPAGVLRRYITDYDPKNPETRIVGVCMKSNENKDFQSPTMFGGISYKIPKDYTEAMLFEMDSIIKSLKESK